MLAAAAWPNRTGQTQLVFRNDRARICVCLINNTKNKQTIFRFFERGKSGVCFRGATRPRVALLPLLGARRLVALLFVLLAGCASSAVERLTKSCCADSLRRFFFFPRSVSVSHSTTKPQKPWSERPRYIQYSKKNRQQPSSAQTAWPLLYPVDAWLVGSEVSEVSLTGNTPINVPCQGCPVS